MYRIIATHDTIGKDDVYLSDATTEDISDEITETLDDCVKRLHEIATEGKANNIEVIYPDGIHGNAHIFFCHEDHPFAEVEYIFNEIDQWADKRRQSRTPQIGADLGSDTQLEQAQENNDLPF